MEWAALVTWVLTAGGGLTMLGLWLKNGGLGQARQPGRRIRPPLIFSHFALAAGGLVVWVIYLIVDKTTLAWVAFVALIPVAVLGFAMLALWLQRRQESGARQSGREASASTGAAGSMPPPTEGERPAEQHFPLPVVAVHGLLAVATVVLVFLTAVGVGGS